MITFARRFTLFNLIVWFMYFDNKLVWITGASSGIGEYLAYALNEEGARLVLSSRKTDELNRVKSRCKNPDSVHVIPLDVSDLDAIPKAVEEVISSFGAIDILINNAGISQRELALNTQLSVDRQIMDVNYFGTIALTKAVAPHMQARRVVEADLRRFQQEGAAAAHRIEQRRTGKIGVPYRSAYAASKHALHGFFDSLRAELYPDGIRVSLICPGYVHTNVTVNALRGDGSPNSVMAESTKGGFSPDVFAKKALKAIKKQKREALIAKTEGLAVLINRFAPAIFARIARGLKLK